MSEDTFRQCQDLCEYYLHDKKMHKIQCKNERCEYYEIFYM